MSDPRAQPGAPDPLSTDHLLGDIKHRSVRGGALVLATQGIKYAVDLTSIVILARLLTPEDFGMIAMVTAVVGFLATFRDAGLSTATIQRKLVSQDQVSALFWANFALSVALIAAITASSPAVAWFYGDDRLLPVTLAIGCGFLFGGLSVQHTALLQRQMRFRALAIAEVGALVAGVVGAVVAALMGLGYWALVVRALTTPFVQMLVVWIATPWRPGPPRWAEGVGSMLRFGSFVTGFKAVNYVGHNVDNVLIGRMLGGPALGIYSKAYALLMLPLRMINNPIASVAIPALSRLQDQPERIRSYFYKAVGLVMTLSMPLVAWLAAVSDSLILTVLGDQWRESIDIFRILTIPAFIATTNVATGWVLIALGLVRRQLQIGVANTIVGTIAIAIGLSWGIEGVAWALVVSALVRRIPTLVYCYWGTPFTLRALGQVMWRPTVAAVLAGAVTFWAHAGFAPDLWPPLALAASLPIFSLAYVAGLLGLPGGRTLVSEALGHLQALRARPATALG